MIDLKTEYKNLELEDEKEAIDKLTELFPDRDVTIIFDYYNRQGLVDGLMENGFNISEDFRHIYYLRTDEVAEQVPKKYRDKVYRCCDYYQDDIMFLFSKVTDEKLLKVIFDNVTSDKSMYKSLYQKSVVVIDYRSNTTNDSIVSDYWNIRGYYCPRKLIKIIINK